MKEYVLIGFMDADFRVYDPEHADEQVNAGAKEIARGTDRKVLIEMAVLARGDRGRQLVDMTEEGVNTTDGLTRTMRKMRKR